MPSSRSAPSPTGMASGTGMPARRRTDFAASLSNASRLASKLEPV